MMLFRPGGGSGGINIAHNFAEMIGRIEAAKSALPQAKTEAMKAVGVQVLSWAFQDFRAKSKGDEAGGVVWIPITEAALISRLRKRAPWKTLQGEKRALRGRRDDAAKAKRKALRAKRDGLVAKERTGAKIGVDTGRLANSLKFGQRGNVYDVKTTSVTVGSQIGYAQFFDEKRPIFGSRFLDGERKKKLDALVERVVKKVEKMLSG